MNFKSLLIPLIAIGIATSAFADGYKFLVVTLDDSSVVSVALKDELVTTFTSTEMVFNDGTTAVTVDREKIKSLGFTIDDPTTGLSVVNENLGSLENLPEGSIVNVYSVDGRLVKRITGSGNAVIPALTPGNYVISVNGQNLKVQVK